MNNNFNDTLEYSDGGESTENKGIGAVLKSIKGNPFFKSQFNIIIESQLKKNSVKIHHSALPINFRRSFPFFLFGVTDFFGGFGTFVKKLSNYDLPFGGNFINKWICTQIQNIQSGLVFNFIINDGVDTYEYIITINSPQIPYGNLMGYINSDKLYLNMIRYVVNNNSINQLKNQLLFLTQSLFGKEQNDFIDPQTFVTGETFNTNIADIPVQFGIDKNLSIFSEINYDCEYIDLVLTVYQTEKIKA